MAKWQGQYTDSFNRSLFANFDVYQVDEFEGTETRSETTKELDETFLPLVFLENTKPVTPSSINLVCANSYFFRFARFFQTSTSWYVVPVPFLPETANFSTFFVQAKAVSNLIEFDYRGEGLISFLIPNFNG